MPTYQLLTDRTLAQASAITPTTLIHIVYTGDPSQNIAGSSYKAELGQLVGLFSGASDTLVTGGTYSAGTITFTNNSGGTFNVSGLTEPFTGGTVSGATVFTNGLTANTFSASSIFVNGVQITGDTFVTGATYSAGTAIFTNNQGNQFNLTGLTEPFSGGSGNCITDLYVSNIHSCSPLNINPLDEGEVYFGSTSGVTIDVTNSRIGIGTTTPQYRLESYGTVGNFSVSLDNSADNFTSISGGTNNFTYLEARTPNTNVVRVGVRPTGDTLNGAYGKEGDGFLFGSITNNGLNIISTPGTGTEDYIRFYAGQNALPANTPDIHIQGTGTTRGYVGLGTTTPTESLHIVSTSSARIRLEADTDDTTETDNAEILITQDGGNTKANISLTPDTNNDLMIGVNAGAGTTPDIRFNTRSDGTSFTTSADTKVIIKNDGKVGVGINEPQYFLQVFSGTSQLLYDPTSVGGLIAVSGNTNIPRFGAIIPAYLTNPGASAVFGIRAWNDVNWPGYGKVGDTFLRASNESNGLNILNTPGGGTEDYIRFYAGQEGLTANTPDIHIQGSGTTRGFVGIKTSNPTANLHVSGNTLVSGSLSATTLNLTSLNTTTAVNNTLTFTDTDVFVSAPGQFSGKIEFYSSDSTGVGVKSYIGGFVSTASEGSIIFATTGATGSLTGGTTVGERMRITSEGRVGIGESVPSYTLEVSSGVENLNEITLFVKNDGDKGLIFVPTADDSGYNFNTRSGDTVIMSTQGEHLVVGAKDGAAFRFSGGSSSINSGNTITTGNKVGIGPDFYAGQPTEYLEVAGNARFRNIGSTASAGALHYTSNGTLTTNTSDIRLKENVEPLTNSLEKILQLTGVTYSWIGESGKRIGMIAQDVEKVIPELVFTNNNTEEKIKGIHQDNLTAVLVEAIKEQQKIIEELKVRISNLES